MKGNSSTRLTGSRVTEPSLVVLAAGTTLALLQSFRVFVPYLVFEVDQSERVTLVTIALAVFGLTLLGALLFQLLGPRITLGLSVVALFMGRLGIQFTTDPGTRWMLGAATVIACFWLLIVLLPLQGSNVALGIGFGLAIDLMVRSLRNTLDLPWMPGTAANLVTIALVVLVALAAYAYASSGDDARLEAPFGPSARFIGLGSGFTLWMVAAGNPGFAEERSGLDLPGGFALLATGTLLALWLEVAAPASWANGNDGRGTAIAMGVLGALAISAWTYGDNRWLDLALIPVFSFAVTVLIIRSAMAPQSPTIRGRWRCGVALTVGLLLQTAFIFLYFARTGPMELMLVPLAILTLTNLFGHHGPSPTVDERRVLRRGIVVAAGCAVAIALTLAYRSEPAPVSASGSDLKVMTFNIQEGFSNENLWSLEETARAIEAQNPDVVVLEEVTLGWLVMSSVDEVRWLADRLDMNYAYSGNSHDGLWGNAILSRLPILSTDSVVYTTTDNLRRGAVSIEVDTGDGPLLVIGTHLDNPRGSTEVRLEQIDELLKFWDGNTPALIAGDFNADPGSPEWQALADAGFVDAAGSDTTTTSEDERRIDYVFVTPDLDVTAYQVPDIWVSDHRPVVVELSPAP